MCNQRTNYEFSSHRACWQEKYFSEIVWYVTKFMEFIWMCVTYREWEDLNIVMVARYMKKKINSIQCEMRIFMLCCILFQGH